MRFPFGGTKYWLEEFWLTRYKIKLANGLYGALPTLYPSEESQASEYGSPLSCPLRGGVHHQTPRMA